MKDDEATSERVGLLERMRLPWLLEHHDRTWVLGLFSLINGLISIGLMALAAWVSRQPFVFPSLGPTAYLFFHRPQAAAASPKHAIFGHAIGVASGLLALVIFGLRDAGPALEAGVDLHRVGAAALSLGLTAGGMTWARVPHPPAGATTLIVSLGILTEWSELGVLMLAVVLLTLQAFVINRLAGLHYPAWAPAPGSAETRPPE